jgi:hypothetical protein
MSSNTSTPDFRETFLPPPLVVNNVNGKPDEGPSVEAATEAVVAAVTKSNLVLVIVALLSSIGVIFPAQVEYPCLLWCKIDPYTC